MAEPTKPQFQLKAANRGLNMPFLVGRNAFAITQSGQLGQLHPTEQLCSSTTDMLGQRQGLEAAVTG